MLLTPNLAGFGVLHSSRPLVLALAGPSGTPAPSLGGQKSYCPPAPIRRWPPEHQGQTLYGKLTQYTLLKPKFSRLGNKLMRKPLLKVGNTRSSSCGFLDFRLLLFFHKACIMSCLHLHSNSMPATYQLTAI